MKKAVVHFLKYNDLVVQYDSYEYVGENAIMFSRRAYGSILVPLFHVYSIEFQA